MKISVTGVEHLNKNKSYVLISNHQSFMDIIVIFAIYSSTLRMVVKKELMYVPIFGWTLWWLRFIYIDRGNRRKSLKSIDKGAAQIKKGMSVLLFPEGTRSSDGKLQPFRPGSFIMAIKSQAPIIPITISGTINVMHRSDPFHLNLNRRVRVIISPPIKTEDYTLEDRHQLKEKIEGIINRNYEKIGYLSFTDHDEKY
jgi:1-acyl-sn-glycerol-3-phosphate acyltransferase